MLKRVFCILVAMICFCVSSVVTAEGTGEIDIEMIFADLGDARYSECLTYLTNGNTLASGESSEYGRTLQMILSGLGYTITVDGKIGKKSISTLNQAQEDLNMKQTSKVDADCFKKLMICLWCYQNPEKAESEAKRLSSDEMWYTIGCAWMNKGRYWLAYKAFENSSFKNSSKKAQKCIQSTPVSKEIYRSEGYDACRASVYLRRQLDKDSMSVLRIFDAENGILVSTLVLTAKGKTTTDLPVGSYYFYLGRGSQWFGKTDMFGENGEYCRLIVNGSETVEVKMGHQYDFYVNPKNSNDNALNVEQIPVTWAEFIQ